MATYVLVAGYWLGGWAWSETSSHLQAHGHRVHAATLTGLGERVHLGNRDVNLTTHTHDVANLIRFEALDDVILVGHSYAGVVIRQVADLIPERLRRLVYVDSGPLPDGVAQADFYPPELRRQYEEIVAAHDGWRLPLPPWEMLEQGNTLRDLGPEERQRFRERATNMPFNAARQPVSLKNAARARIPRAAIWCTFTSQQVRAMASGDSPLFKELTAPDWTFLDLPTGHWPMFSKPKELGELLERCARP